MKLPGHFGGTKVTLGRGSARAGLFTPLDPNGWQARFGRSQHRGNGFDLNSKVGKKEKEKPAFNKRVGTVFALDYGRLMGDPIYFAIYFDPVYFDPIYSSFIPVYPT